MDFNATAFATYFFSLHSASGLAADSGSIQAWVGLIAAIGTVVAAFIAAWPLIRQSADRRRQEARLAEASRAEIDARMLSVFVELMSRAHSRGSWALADSALQAILSRDGPLTPKTLGDLNALVGAAGVVGALGAGEQAAAIAAVAELGVRYPILREPALRGLENVESWPNPPAGDALVTGLRRLRALPKDQP